MSVHKRQPEWYSLSVGLERKEGTSALLRGTLPDMYGIHVICYFFDHSTSPSSNGLGKHFGAFDELRLSPFSIRTGHFQSC
jgi:hypothetical protein